MATYIPGLVQIRPQYSQSTDDDIPENVTWWNAEGYVAPLTISQLTAIQAAFNTAWATLWEHVGSTTNQYTGSIVTDWGSFVGLSVDNSAFTPVAGPGAGQAGDQVAALVSLHEAQRYRGGHGRMYLPGISIANMTGGSSLTTAAQSGVQASLAALVTGMAAISGANAGPVQQVVFHQKSHVPGTIPPVLIGAFFNPIVGSTCQSKVATQRRRLRKR
jgi:hypothetical protein